MAAAQIDATSSRSFDSFSRDELVAEIHRLEARYDALLQEKERAAKRYEDHYTKWAHFKKYMQTDKKSFRTGGSPAKNKKSVVGSNLLKIQKKLMRKLESMFSSIGQLHFSVTVTQAHVASTLTPLRNPRTKELLLWVMIYIPMPT